MWATNDDAGWVVRLEGRAERIDAALRVIEAARRSLARGHLAEDEFSALPEAARLIDLVTAATDEARADDAHHLHERLVRARSSFERVTRRVLALVAEPADTRSFGSLVERLSPHVPIRCAGPAGSTRSHTLASRVVFPLAWFTLPALLLGWYLLPVALLVVTIIDWLLLPRIAVTARGLFLDAQWIPFSQMSFCRPTSTSTELVLSSGDRLRLPEGPVSRILREAGVAFR